MAFISTCFLLVVIASTSLSQSSIPTTFPNGVIQISSKGDELWAIDNGNLIYRWSGSQWEHILGSGGCIGASPDGYTWVADMLGRVNRWNKDTRTWEILPGVAKRISALSRDVAVVVSDDDAIYLWKGNAWTKIGVDALWVSIGDQEEIWAVNKNDGSIWRWANPSQGLNGWVKKDGTAVQIDVQSPTRIVHRNEAQQVFVLDKDGKTWLPKGVKASSVAIGRNRIFAIESIVKAVA